MLGLMSKSQQDKEKLGWLHVYQRKIIMHIKREKKKLLTGSQKETINTPTTITDMMKVGKEYGNLQICDDFTIISRII